MNPYGKPSRLSHRQSRDCHLPSRSVEAGTRECCRVGFPTPFPLGSRRVESNTPHCGNLSLERKLPHSNHFWVAFGPQVNHSEASTVREGVESGRIPGEMRAASAPDRPGPHGSILSGSVCACSARNGGMGPPWHRIRLPRCRRADAPGAREASSFGAEESRAGR